MFRSMCVYVCVYASFRVYVFVCVYVCVYKYVRLHDPVRVDQFI